MAGVVSFTISKKRINLQNRKNILLYEGQTIQDILKTPENTTNITRTSKKFKVLMSKENVNGALKLLTNSISNGILPLSNKTLDLLKRKHTEPREPSSETPLQGPFRPIHPVAFDDTAKLWSCKQQY